MATTTTKTTTPDAATLVREAEVELAAAEAERAELKQRTSGTVVRPTTRREPHTVIRQTGRAEVVMVDVRGQETEHVGALGRLQARRALVDAEDRVGLAAERLEEARAAAATDARAQRARAIEAGEQVVRAALPGLIAEVRKVQERFQAFHDEIARLDQAVGGAAYFEPMVACPALMPTGMLDAWIAYASGAFPTERR